MNSGGYDALGRGGLAIPKKTADSWLI